MFERFIFGTDLSPATFAIASCLKDLQKFGAKQCLLVHCISMKQGAALALSYQPPEAYTAELESQKQILSDLGFTVEGRIEFGSPKTRLTGLAIEEDYPLIVLGSQGRSLLADFVLGGVAYGVISRSRTPVLVLPVKGISGDEQQCESIGWCEFTRHVLFATDFSDTADRAFSYVEEMVRTGVSQVTLIHVQHPAAFTDVSEAKRDDYNRLDRDRLQQLQLRLQKAGNTEVSIELPSGIPKNEVARFANASEISLVVMGTQGRGFPRELTLGSIAGNTARTSRVPTLLIPPG